MAQRPADRMAPIALRTRFFDDLLQRVTWECHVGQVVLMAAGLDTRAFRLEWPGGTHVFELDQPTVLQHKAQVLRDAGAEPKCARSTVEGDLGRDWAAPGSFLGFDVVNHVTLTHPLTRDWLDMQARAGAPWLGALDDPLAYLSALGWRAELTQPGQPDASHGRWPYPVYPPTMPDLPHHWLVTAQKEA